LSYHRETPPAVVSVGRGLEVEGRVSVGGVEGGLRQALETGVQILAGGLLRTLVQLAELHFVACFAFVAGCADALKVVPGDIAKSLVQTRVVPARVVRLHSAQHGGLLEDHFSEGSRNLKGVTLIFFNLSISVQLKMKNTREIYRLIFKKIVRVKLILLRDFVTGFFRLHFS
jgi:hypothetical protein